MRRHNINIISTRPIPSPTGVLVLNSATRTDVDPTAAPVAPSAWTTPASRQLVALLLLFLALTLLMPDHGLQLDALRKMALGDKDAPTSAFAEAQTYLYGLRDALIPLALPLGAIGLTGGGVAYMMGNMMAQKILGGVVIGLALTLMAPTLVA